MLKMEDAARWAEDIRGIATRAALDPLVEGALSDLARRIDNAIARERMQTQPAAMIDAVERCGYGVILWRPLDIAPKDRDIWGWIKGDATKLRWSESAGAFFWRGERRTVIYESHEIAGWTEIPPPPRAEGDGR